MKSKLFFLAIMLAALTMCVTSCNKEIDKENHPDGPLDERLVGKWEFDHKGSTTQWPYIDTWEFYSNGNCYRYYKNGYSYYKWTATEGTLTLKFNCGEWERQYVIQNSLLSFDIDSPEEQQTWYHKYQ